MIRHFEHVWMKESWATYMESVWVEDHKSQDEFRYTMYLDLLSYVEETKKYVRPIVNRTYASSWSMYDAHTYPVLSIITFREY